MAAIVTESLTKRYGGHLPFARGSDTPALRDLSIEVREGEIFGFLGPNGAGKSTLIRLLLGFLHPTSGDGRVLGLGITTRSEEIRRRTGYLPGGIALYETMTGEEQLRYLASLDGQPARLRDELIDRLELSRRDLRRQIRDYSRGMRQKVGIIQALQHDPELAILDEPTEGLDPLMQRSFYEILEDRRAAGRTVFFSSHILSEVERVCDRVAIVRRGELVELADVHALLRHRRRRVELRFEGLPPELEGVAGVADIHVADDILTCQLEGDPGPFLAAIHASAIHDLLIEPARLEEAFMEFYADTASTPPGEDEPASPREAA